MNRKSGRRRRAVLINDVDQKRLEEGKTPSWLEVSEHPRTEDSSLPGELSARDRRLLEDVPPHWSPPA